MDEDEEFIKFEITDADREFSYGNSKPKKLSKNKAIYGIFAESESDDENDFKKKKTDYTSGIGFVKSDSILNEEKSSTKKDHEIKDSKKLKQRPQFGKTMSSSIRQEFGHWEMYTKGVGSKLLQKMGYQPGKGLGKNLQGIVEPIEAKKRPGSGAIGLYGSEITSNIPKKGSDLIEKNEEEIFEKGVLNKNWQSKKNKNIIKKYEKSTEDIIKESLKKSWNNEAQELTNVKIIDMTGPEQRILNGLSQTHKSRAEKPKSTYEISQFNTRFDIPELKQNIERLILLSEKNVFKLKAEHNRNKLQIENLTEEKERLHRLLIVQKEQVELIQMFVKLVEEFQELIDKPERKNLTFIQALEMFEKFMNENVKKQNRLLKIDNLFLCVFHRVLKVELKSCWRNPFEEQKKSDQDYYCLFERLKNLVINKKTFEILLWDHWNTAISRALQTWPSMKNCTPLIEFFKKWHHLLPKWMFEHFIANNVMSKLRNDVEIWNPTADSIPIDSWVQPWVLLLQITETCNANELSFIFEPIYEIIRMKLANALINWYPGDDSARLILAPWKNFFSEASLQTFLDINIIPKLEQSMQQLSINPNQQSLNEWNWVMSWKNLISLNTIVSILERFFFVKWLNVLYGWLRSPVVNFNEVSSWYQSWKALMGEDLVQNATVKEFFRKALIMMDHAVNSNNGLQSFCSYYSPNHQIPLPQTVVSTHNTSNFNSNALSFRQMIELKANQIGILFMPVSNRFENGHQVFKFGPHLVFIDNQVIFHQSYSQLKRLWTPISLETLIESCTNVP